MKQPRKLVLKEKKVLSAIGLNPENWAVHKEDSDYLYVVHKISGRKRKIIKTPLGRKAARGTKNKKKIVVLYTESEEKSSESGIV